MASSSSAMAETAMPSALPVFLRQPLTDEQKKEIITLTSSQEPRSVLCSIETSPNRIFQDIAKKRGFANRKSVSIVFDGQDKVVKFNDYHRTLVGYLKHVKTNNILALEITQVQKGEKNRHSTLLLIKKSTPYQSYYYDPYEHDSQRHKDHPVKKPERFLDRGIAALPQKLKIIKLKNPLSEQQDRGDGEGNCATCVDRFHNKIVFPECFPQDLAEIEKLNPGFLKFIGVKMTPASSSSIISTALVAKVNDISQEISTLKIENQKLESELNNVKEVIEASSGFFKRFDILERLYEIQIKGRKKEKEAAVTQGILEKKEKSNIEEVLTKASENCQENHDELVSIYVSLCREINDAHSLSSENLRKQSAIASKRQAQSDTEETIKQLELKNFELKCNLIKVQIDCKFEGKHNEKFSQLWQLLHMQIDARMQENEAAVKLCSSEAAKNKMRDALSQASKTEQEIHHKLAEEFVTQFTICSMFLPRPPQPEPRPPRPSSDIKCFVCDLFKLPEKYDSSHDIAGANTEDLIDEYRGAREKCLYIPVGAVEAIGGINKAIENARHYYQQRQWPVNGEQNFPRPKELIYFPKVYNENLDGFIVPCTSVPPFLKNGIDFLMSREQEYNEREQQDMSVSQVRASTFFPFINASFKELAPKMVDAFKKFDKKFSQTGVMRNNGHISPPT